MFIKKENSENFKKDKPYSEQNFEEGKKSYSRMSTFKSENIYSGTLQELLQWKVEYERKIKAIEEQKIEKEQQKEIPKRKDALEQKLIIETEPDSLRNYNLANRSILSAKSIFGPKTDPEILEYSRSSFHNSEKESIKINEKEFVKEKYNLDSKNRKKKIPYEERGFNTYHGEGNVD